MDITGLLKAQAILEAVTKKLGDNQKAWLTQNLDSFIPYFNSGQADDALLLFLEDFASYVLNNKTK